MVACNIHGTYIRWLHVHGTYIRWWPAISIVLILDGTYIRWLHVQHGGYNVHGTYIRWLPVISMVLILDGWHAHGTFIRWLHTMLTLFLTPPDYFPPLSISLTLSIFYLSLSHTCLSHAL